MLANDDALKRTFTELFAPAVDRVVARSVPFVDSWRRLTASTPGCYDEAYAVCFASSTHRDVEHPG